MATLTPGVLTKLLKHAGDNNNNHKVISEHRTPLLQVIEIVPALATKSDDPWCTKGFYLKLSDSEHSAYVALADEDLELIYGDKVKIGQFLYVERLKVEVGKRVPVIKGIRVVPRPRACVGSPKELISSDLLMRRKGSGGGRRESLGISKRLVVDGDGGLRAKDGGFGSGRRLSLDSARKGWESPKSANAGRSSVSRLKSETPVGRRLASVSQQVMATSDKKREMPCIPLLAKVIVGADKKPSRLTNSLVMSKPSGTLSPRLKEKNLVTDLKLTVGADKKQSRPSVSLVTSKLSSISSLRSKEKNLVTDAKVKLDEGIRGCVNKVSLSSLPDREISWSSLPVNMQELGKGVVSNRDVAILTAARALEEASVMERLVGCMSIFADLSESSENCSAGLVVETFLDLHLSMERAASVIDMLLGSNASGTNSISGVSPQLQSDSFNNYASKNSKAWIQAAVETDLSRFSLYSEQDNKGALNDKKSYRIVLENTIKEALEIRTLPNARTSIGQNGRTAHVVAKSLHKPLSAPRKVKNEVESSNRNALKDAASLAHKLILVSRQWFLQYLETSLKKGFGIQGKDKSIQIFLRNLKRVNQWLQELVGSKHEIDERVEAVRKKLYNFLLENVDSSSRASK